ncbi:MAG: M14 family metallopeptidase [Bacteroidota bacterium]
MARMLFFILLFSPFLLFPQPGKKKVYTTTLTYPEIIAAYQSLEKKSPYAKLLTCDTTDIGKPLHLFVISKSKVFDPAGVSKLGKTVLLINNGIHPGEPDGIDASVEFATTLLSNEKNIPDSVVICIIPVYNIDGCLNRGKYSRANQNGPEEYGFRGNAQNLDLNRDFIKADSKNAKAFIRIFQDWKPHVFVDNHTSDGADYQYVMTLIATQRNKLHPVLSEYMTSEMVPYLYDRMKEKKYEMCPYVETLADIPDKGIVEFLETPRYSTGYAALFNCIGFVPETHMWKPYNDRVWSTYELLLAITEITERDAARIAVKKNAADLSVLTQKELFFNYRLDTTRFDSIEFRGYEAEYKVSTISGLQRLFYNRNKPYTKKIRFYNRYTPLVKVTRPACYLIPQAWDKVIERLKLNKVILQRLSKDTSITCEVYYIQSYETVKTPYEGHYLHYSIKTYKETQTLNFYKGDYVVHTSYNGRYVAETLEPESEDSFFAWNFFDGILQQKEWFSPYIFEEKAVEILNADPKLKEELEAKKKTDKDLAASHWAQLYFIYKNSVYYEKSHNRYPVARLHEHTALPVD